MESHHHEDSKSSSEETDRSNDDSMGTGRSYECVFCKRGFTTAQALGGHMNIHRKDRAKSRPSSVPSISSKVDEEEYASYRGYPPIQSYPPPHHHHYPTNNHHEVHLNYQSFFPTSNSWGTYGHAHHAHGDAFYVQSSHQLNHHHHHLMGDWRSSLSLQIGSSYVEDNKEIREDGNEHDDELDLELRLGHDP